MSAILKMHLAFCVRGNKPEPEDLMLSSAIYGSMRFKTARDTLKRLMTVEETSKPIQRFVLNVFEQVGHIETFRDILAHQQMGTATNIAGIWHITDAASTKTIKESIVYTFDLALLSSASQDFIIAAASLEIYSTSERLFDEGNFDGSLVPWQYKSSDLRLVPRNKRPNFEGLFP